MTNPSLNAAARPIDLFGRRASLFPSFVLRRSSFVPDNPMNLQQIKFGVLPSSKTASAFPTRQWRVYTAQPVVSKHIKTLEDELILKIFERRASASPTHAGRRGGLCHRQAAERRRVQPEALASDMSNAKEGVLTIATTHTQARYVLPRVVTQFGASIPASSSS